MSRTDDVIWNGVAHAFCEALGLDDDEVTPDALVIDDLGAESLDFLDIAFRLERTFRIKIPRGEVQRSAEQRSGEAFEVEGKLTAAGARALREALPEVPQDPIVAGFPIRDIARLFTIQTFVNLVARQLEQQRSAARSSTLRVPRYAAAHAVRLELPLSKTLQRARVGAWPWVVVLTALLTLTACTVPLPGSRGSTNDDDDAADDDDAVSDDDDDTLPDRPISSQELADFVSYFPTVTSGGRVEVPANLLTEEALDRGNVDVIELYGPAGEILGLARHVFTPVTCLAGVCSAIRFTLVFETDVEFMDVFHPLDAPDELQKYWQEQYLTFTAEDMVMLRNQLLDPPPIMVAAPDNDALVQGSNASAPTLPEYQPFVVRGAAFTCLTILNYMLDTQEILDELDLGAAR